MPIISNNSSLNYLFGDLKKITDRYYFNSVSINMQTKLNFKQ